MIVLVVLLSLFSGAYLKYFTRSDSDNPSADDMTMLGRVSSYSIYVVNILTNQGIVSIVICFSFYVQMTSFLLKEIWCPADASRSGSLSGCGF